MINGDLQKLEPGSRIRLFEVDGSAFSADILRFHLYSIAHTENEILTAGGNEHYLPAKSIWWQAQRYSAWPVQAEGLEAAASGSSAQPCLMVGNPDSSVSTLCLKYDDMLGARVTIHDTLLHYLDGRDFGGGNPHADPT